MPKRDNLEEKPQIDTSDPCYCPACGQLSFAAFPVHIREIDGNDTLVCHIVKCSECGRIKRYGLNLGIGKIKGRKMYANYGNWPELERNHIKPNAFIDAIIANPQGHIWLDANNGLQPVRPEGNQADALRRLQAFVKSKGRFWGAYD